MYQNNRNLKGERMNADGTIVMPKIEKSNLLSKCFGYLFLAILITFATAIIMNFTFIKFLVNKVTKGDGIAVTNGINIYIGTVIGAAIILIVLSITLNILLRNGKRNITAPFVLYSVVMGILMGSLILFIPFEIVFTAIGVTALSFGIMGLIARFTRKLSSRPFLVVGTAGLLGCLFLTLALFIIQVAAPGSVLLDMWWIDYLFLFVIMMFTIVDIKNIDRIAQAGVENKNVALYCALTLFNDFVYIFIKVLLILIRYSARRK